MPKYRRRPRRLPVAESAAATLDRAAEAISTAPWNGDACRFTIQQWRRSCLVDTGQGDEDSKERYKLPVREPGGALSRGGVHAAAGGHGIGAVKGISDEMRRRVARKLVSLYRNQLDEDPPESLLALAGMSEEAAVNSRRGDRVEVGETAVVEAPRNGRPGRLLVHLIKAGWSGNDNFYSAGVLREAARSRAFPRGTQAFIDHPTEEEAQARPVGSIRNLAAVLNEDARWDEREQALTAEVRLFAPWRETITDMAEAIGMSIRAWVSGEHGEVDGREGFIVSEIAAGRSVDFVTKPAAGGAIVSVLESVGTRALAEARNVGAWLESRLHLALTQLGDDMYGEGRLTRPERITLSQAIGDALQAWTTRVEADAPQLFRRDLYDDPDDGDMPHMTDEARQVTEAPTEQVRMALHNAVRAAYSGEETYAWVRDFDPARAVVWFEVSDRTECRLWQQPYSIGANGQASLSGERVEVVARTVYAPMSGDETATESAPGPRVETATADAATQTPAVQQPDGTDPAPGVQPADEEREGEMPEEPINEAQARELEEARKLAETAQAERDAARVRLAESERETARLKATEAARPIAVQMVTQADIPAAARVRVLDEALRSVPLTEDLTLDQATFKARVDEALQRESAYLASIKEEEGAGQVRGLGRSESVTSTVVTGGQVSTGRADSSQIHTELVEMYKRRGMSDEAARFAATGRP